MSSPKSNNLLEGIDHAGTAGDESGGKSLTLPAVPGWAQALVIAAALVVGGYTLLTMLKDDNIQEASSRLRTVIDVNTGEVFVDFNIADAATLPYTNPKTGEATLYPAEKCFWTPDGGVTMEPHYVLLNAFKGDDTPTTCPDCGRPVRQFNPMPPLELMIEAAENAP